jgi:hypothetical protein
MRVIDDARYQGSTPRGHASPWLQQALGRTGHIPSPTSRPLPATPRTTSTSGYAEGAGSGYTDFTASRSVRAPGPTPPPRNASAQKRSLHASSGGGGRSPHINVWGGNTGPMVTQEAWSGGGKGLLDELGVGSENNGAML